MITVTDLYKSFPMGGQTLTVLKGSIQIQRGELIAIVGASGLERARCSILWDARSSYDRDGPLRRAGYVSHVGG